MGIFIAVGTDARLGNMLERLGSSFHETLVILGILQFTPSCMGLR